MKIIQSVIIGTLVAMSFTAVVFAEDGGKPVIPAGPTYASSPANDDQKDSNAVQADTKTVKAKEKADAKVAKEKATADAQAAKDAATPVAK